MTYGEEDVAAIELGDSDINVDDPDRWVRESISYLAHVELLCCEEVGNLDLIGIAACSKGIYEGDRGAKSAHSFTLPIPSITVSHSPISPRQDSWLQGCTCTPEIHAQEECRPPGL
jgi:hypothetical protein